VTATEEEGSGPAPPAERRAPWRWIGRGALAVLGVAAIGVIVQLAGKEGVGRVLVVAAPWLPLVLAVEGSRIGVESVATRALYGAAGRAIPRQALVLAHFVAYAMNMALPAGRTLAEGYKAGALARYANAPLAAAVGTANQALSLLAVAALSVPCAIAAYARTGMSALTIGVLIHTASVGASALAIQLASRSARLLALVTRISPRFAGSIAKYRDACSVHGVVPVRPFLLHAAGRALQIVGLAILLAAVSGRFSIGDSLVGQAVAFVGTTAGDLVPLQLGATDGAWALAGPLFGLTAADAVGVAILAHGVQIAWVAIGALVPVLRRSDTPPTR
jgi:hypothetical protein